MIGILMMVVLGAGGAWEQCAATGTAPALDHVILVVRDLGSAGAAFEAAGFRLKPGRLHANNLLNRHVKFRNGTEIELMTVRGQAGDAMAQDYADLLVAGEGGVYVALKALDFAAVEPAARSADLEVLHSRSGPWQFISFTPSSPAAAVFFSPGGPLASDPDSLLTHEPDVDGLAEAWLEGGEGLTQLLAGLGAVRCDSARSPDGRTGTRWALGRGAIVVVPAPPAQRPRVLGVVLRSRTAVTRTIRPIPGFWIRYTR